MLIVLGLLHPTNCRDIELEKKSVIKFGWGMMFDYYGQMLHGLNKYNLIVGVEIPTMEELNLEVPYMFQPSICQTLASRYKTRIVASKRPLHTPSVTRPICDSAVE